MPQCFSFKEILTDKLPTLNQEYETTLVGGERPKVDYNEEGEPTDDAIPLSVEDMQRIYQPWRFSVIVKLIGRKIPHQYLRSKLTDLWKPTENPVLLDIGWGFYIAKFAKPKIRDKAIHGGP